MAFSQIVNESQLDAWVRGNAAVAQEKIVELVWRLVCVSCPKAIHRRFPLGDSIGQHGPDGELETAVGFDPFIPEGEIIWEIGTGVHARKKANSDYKSSTDNTPEEVRRKTTFVFVTPLSGRRDWPDTWETDGISTWIDNKKGLNQWKDVKVLDGCQLIDWVSHFPAVGHWLARVIWQLPSDFDTTENHWHLISSYGEPPPLLPDLFTVGRNAAIDKLRQFIIEQNNSQLRIETRYRQYSKDFVSAFVASLDDDERADFQHKILILSSPEAFKGACYLNESHVLIVDFDLDANSGHELIQRAVSKGHRVIYFSPPGGPPHGNFFSLYTPAVHQMKEALIKSGYSEERARTLTNRSGKDLNALLRLIQDLSAMPEWADSSESSDLAIAQLIGQWQDSSDGDQKIIEELSGKAYREWIVNIRQAASAKAAPLEFFNGRWKLTSRFEPWVYLEKLIGPEILDRIERLAITVLSESDPALDLPKDQRYATGIYGRKCRYSKQLREGISETLALMGAHGDSLSLCQGRKPQQIARQVVETLLENADSIRWASLNDVLPLLAEASPDAFLNAVASASERPDGPFSGVFAEEGSGFLGGGPYTTGLLWGLESLAWSNDYLLRVCGILADLASVDPGGQWQNRPSNSLVTILLPWLPQTVANVDRRHATVKLIVREHPDVAWELLLGLLPEYHSASRYTHRPKWQNFIPEDWSAGVTYEERWGDEAFYADLALELAGTDPDRLEKLLQYYFLLSPVFSNFADNYRARLKSEGVLALTQDQRLVLWSALKAKISHHRKYADSDVWGVGVSEEQLQALDEVAEKLQPENSEIQYKRLFSEREFDLYDETGNWEKQREILLHRRIDALREIIDKGGFGGLKSFWRSVHSPDEVGNAYGSDSERADDSKVLPEMLESDNNHDLRFALSYVWRRFYVGGWDWIDDIDRSSWSVNAKAQFFSSLPFVNGVWERVDAELADKSSEYWKHTQVHMDRQHLERIDYAIGQLIDNGRPDAAIRCFLVEDLWGGKFSEIGLRALETFTDKNHIHTHVIGEVFNHLQKDDSVDEERLAKMEMKFLELLSRFDQARPRTLYRHLAERPDFFCQVIRLLYRPKGNVDVQTEEKTDIDENTAKFAQRAYKLLADWEHPPGLRSDGTFDEECLHKWIMAVKSSCVKSGHWESASHHIGEVFYYAPTDESGLWVEPVCKLLDSKDDVKYRRGLTIRIYNSRGAYGFSGGKAEIELAEKWECIATHAENKGFVRLGASLRDIGRSYREDAERSVAEDQHMF